MIAVSKDSVLQQFREEFGREPGGVWSAPGRVNLIGEHTDYNGGLCLPVALENRTLVALAPRDDHILRIRSRQSGEAYVGPVGVVADGWAAYPTAAVWSLGESGPAIRGADVLIDSTVPVGAGLSSSAALICSTMLAFNDLHGGALTRRALVAASIRAENDGVGAPTGGMDQTVALLARASTALLLDCRDSSVEYIPFDVRAAGFDLVVIDTRVQHSLTDGRYADRRNQCLDAATALGITQLRDADAGQVEALTDPVLRTRARHVVTENERTRRVAELLRRGHIAEIGPHLDASHESLREDFAVSCTELDVAVATARQAGAVGARMTGGGFGGSAVALVPGAATAAVTAAVRQAYAERSWSQPHFHIVAAAGEAGSRIHPLPRKTVARSASHK